MCKRPAPIYQFCWDSEGTFWGVAFHCNTIYWQSYPVENQVSDVMAAQANTATSSELVAEEPKQGMDNGYI